MHPEPPQGGAEPDNPVSPTFVREFSEGNGSACALSDVQKAMIEIFAGAAVQLGLPKSLGQIYGVLFASPSPLAFRDIVDLLGISAGSASQGIRVLRELGAIHPVDVPGDRREHFAAELSLRRVLGGVLKDRVQGPLESGTARLKAIEARLDRAGPDEPDAEFLRGRAESLRTWQRKALLVLPMLRTFLGTRDP